MAEKGDFNAILEHFSALPAQLQEKTLLTAVKAHFGGETGKQTELLDFIA